MARRIVDMLTDKKAENIVLMDIRGRSVFADYFVICNGTSERQLKTIVDTVLEEMKHKYGKHAHHVEGDPADGWVLVDYLDIIIHVFAPEKRTFYDLEGFWGDSPILLKVQ